MPSAAPGAELDELDELIGAYRTLGLEFRASETAIRMRYRELAQRHHPDKWPLGSPEQTEAADRMKGINAAHALIEHAPLRFYSVASTPISDFDRPPAPPPNPSRPLGAGSETLLRFAVGIGIGALAATALGRSHVPGAAAYFWLLPLVTGLALTRTSDLPEILQVLQVLRMLRMLRWLLWW